jgi:hypothetical protein
MSFSVLALLLVAGSAPSPAPLTSVQRAVVSAVLSYEAAMSGFPAHRPALVLDHTEEWLPLDTDPATYDDAPLEERAHLRDTWAIQLPTGLRADNCSTPLAPYAPPAPFSLYPTDVFEQDNASDETLEALRQFLGSEPLAYSVSRPFVASSGTTATVVLHRVYTWTGCGGVDLLTLSLTSGQWTVQSDKSVLFW